MSVLFKNKMMTNIALPEPLPTTKTALFKRKLISQQITIIAAHLPSPSLPAQAKLLPSIKHIKQIIKLQLVLPKRKPHFLPACLDAVLFANEHTAGQ